MSSPQVGVGVLIIRNGRVLLGKGKALTALVPGLRQADILNLASRLKTVHDVKFWKKPGWNSQLFGTGLSPTTCSRQIISTM